MYAKITITIAHSSNLVQTAPIPIMVFEDKYRFVILVLSTAALSVVFANVLSFNFTITCMTEETYHWQNFSVNLGFDVFEKVDFDPPKLPDASLPETKPEVTESPFPDIDIPGIKVPTPGFNWQTFNIAKTNPGLFFRIMKKVAYEVGTRAAERAGEEFDPRNIDFKKFRDGFNLTDFNPDIVYRIKEYLLEKITTGKQTVKWVELESGNITEQVSDIDIKNVELTNITWNGEINGRIKIIDKAADYYYTDTEKAILFSVVGLGGLLFLPVFGKLHDKWGTRLTFTLIGIATAIATGLVPLVAAFGFIPLVILRFIVHGLAFASLFPVIGHILQAWGPYAESGYYLGGLTGFLPLGGAIAFVLGGLFCSLGAWEVTYVALALLTAVTVGIWWIVYRDTPGEHNRVSFREAAVINEGKVVPTGRSKHSRCNLPCKDILKSKPVWAIWIGAYGGFAAFFVLTFLPIYFRDVIHYDAFSAGAFSALPLLVAVLLKLHAGVLSDRVKKPATLKLRIFNTLAFVGAAVFFLLVAFLVTDESPLIGVIFFVAAGALLAFSVGGFYKAVPSVGRQYTPFLSGQLGAIAALTFALVSSAVFIFTIPDHWTCLFIFTAVLLILTAVGFAALANGEPGTFTGDVNNDIAAAGNGEQMKPIIKGTNGSQA
uniref:MFS domain-containing protein n=1 Tax=Panagrellus redivivus TaxID=6233 RepID=A0A7E4W4Q9_PANRE